MGNDTADCKILNHREFLDLMFLYCPEGRLDRIGWPNCHDIVCMNSGQRFISTIQRAEDI